MAHKRKIKDAQALYEALKLCSAELFAQCADQKRAMEYVEQARDAMSAWDPVENPPRRREVEERPYVTKEKLADTKTLFLYGSGKAGNYDLGTLHLNDSFEVIHVDELARLRGIETAWLQLEALAKDA